MLNTAGLCCKGRLENQENSHWDAMLKYNVVGTLRTARTFLPLLKNKRGKSIYAKYQRPTYFRPRPQDLLTVTEPGSKDGEEVTDPVTPFLTQSVNNNHYIQPTVTYYTSLQFISC